MFPQGYFGNVRFRLGPQTPTQPLAQLKSDVKQLVAFWHALYADGKYIKKEAFVGNGMLQAG